MSALEQIKAHVQAELAAGKQINWDAAFATSRPTKKQILEWYEDAPKGAKKAELIEWLARHALEGAKP